ncbi:hypothetical protein BMETH_1583_0 [methanotrophic bacterial endosymbiont of Bathymodiolus sp.]|nr:hypothetical protein BMETH_1583_0 [methanotrophic bacterial endosymbiont of Bathymodiolus sp.]
MGIHGIAAVVLQVTIIADLQCKKEKCCNTQANKQPY